MTVTAITPARRRRAKGTGSVFFAPSSGLWIGQREIPTPRGEKRRWQRVTAATYCGMLRKFSQLDGGHGPTRPSYPRSRWENLQKARELGTHTQGHWYAKLFAQHGICHYCGEVGVRKELLTDGREVWMPFLTKDHMTPITRGGSDGIDNVVGACEPCNRTKGTMTADEYFAFLADRKGRLALVARTIEAEVVGRQPMAAGVDFTAVAQAVLEALDAR